MLEFFIKYNLSWLNSSSWTKLVDATIGKLMTELMEIIFSVVGSIVKMIGLLLDYSINVTVLEMASNVDGITAIDTLWTTFRDLGNIVFIGVLLYIAIRTILNVGNNFNTKRILIRLVIVALFVNFSLFATKVVIDTSNVVALQFYNSIQVENCEQDTCNISHFFADVTNISSVQSPEAIESIENSDADTVHFRILLARLLGVIFLLITGFIMFAIALLLIIRFGFLILLMIASPLAFIAFILPSTSKIGEKWMQNLFSQSFFAPILFAMIYVVASLGTELQSGIGGGNPDLMSAILGSESDNLGVIIIFILMIILMGYSLVIAKNMGAAGASTTIKLGKTARNAGSAAVVGAGAFGMRQTVGRGAARLKDSGKLKEWGEKNFATRAMAGGILRKADDVSKKEFDYRNTSSGKKSKLIGKQAKRSGGFEGGKKRKQKKYDRTADLYNAENRDEKDELQNAERDLEQKARLSTLEKSDKDIQGLKQKQKELRKIEKGTEAISESELATLRQQSKNAQNWFTKIKKATENMKGKDVEALWEQAQNTGQIEDPVDQDMSWQRGDNGVWYKHNADGQRTGTSAQADSLRSTIREIKDGSKLDEVKNRAQNQARIFQDGLKDYQKRTDAQEEVSQLKKRVDNKLEDMLSTYGVEKKDGEDNLKDIRDRIENAGEEAKKTKQQIKTQQLQRTRSFEDSIEQGIIPTTNSGSSVDYSGGHWKREYVAGKRKDRNKSKQKKNQEKIGGVMEFMEKMEKSGVDLDEVNNFIEKKNQDSDNSNSDSSSVSTESDDDN